MRLVASGWSYLTVRVYPFPALTRPMHKFSGECGEELVITAKTILIVSTDDKTVNAPVFVQHNSKHPCLLGTDVISFRDLYTLC